MDRVDRIIAIQRAHKLSANLQSNATRSTLLDRLLVEKRKTQEKTHDGAGSRGSSTQSGVGVD